MSFCMKERGLYENGWSSSPYGMSHRSRVVLWTVTYLLGINRNGVVSSYDGKMCSLRTEGTQHGCGHYIITKKVDRRDCMSEYCIYSDYHSENCPHCPNCKRYLDPDHSETITVRTNAYCTSCEYWYHGAGAKRRR